MASLPQKFKLLATQCAVAGSPTRSPTTSPVIHLRRRKTLRMLLGRSDGGEAGGARRRFVDCCGPPDLAVGRSPEKVREMPSVRRKLKDLFVSSPPPSRNLREGFLPSAGGGGGGGRRSWTRSQRPLSATLRQRLLRRAWRPVLVAIPE